MRWILPNARSKQIDADCQEPAEIISISLSVPFLVIEGLILVRRADPSLSLPRPFLMFASSGGHRPFFIQCFFISFVFKKICGDPLPTHKLGHHLQRNQSSQRFCLLKRGVGHVSSLHASGTALRISAFLMPAFRAQSTSFSQSSSSVR